MKKVIIIGCPGCGKSTFAGKLGDITGLAVYHLDMMFWNADRTVVDRETFIGRLSDAMNTPQWIIDGNYASTMEMRLAECDTVFFLDYPTEVCLDGIESRRGRPRSDMPWIEDGTDDEFISFVRNFGTDIKPMILELLSKYDDKDIVVFNSRAEATEYLSSLGYERGV